MPTHGTASHVDVVVVGAGIVGLAVAYEILQRGATVTVIAPRDVSAFGAASPAAGAMLSIFSEVEPDDLEARVAEDVGERLRADALWNIWLQALDERGVAVHRTAGTWVVGRPDEYLALDAIAGSAARYGHVAEWHRGTDVPGLVPGRAIGAALWIPSELGVDALQLLSALSDTLLANPRFRWQDDVATSTSSGSDSVIVTCQRGSVVAAQHVVVAAGAATRTLMPSSAEFPVLLRGRGSGLTLRAEHPAENVIRTPNRAFNCGTHVVPRREGLTYVGGTNRQEYRVNSAGRCNAAVDEIAVLIDTVTSDIDERLFEADFIGIRTGHRPYTLDRLPLIGPTADHRVHVATATYRSGYMLAPRIAQIVADEMERPGSHVAHPYRLTRPSLRQDPGAVVREACLQLVGAISEPGGHLPPGIQSRFADFVALAFNTMLASPDDDTQQLLNEVRALWETAPMAETLPAILRLISSHQGT